jgi:hypothetical protein
MPATAGIQYTLRLMWTRLWWLAAVPWLLDRPLLRAMTAEGR